MIGLICRSQLVNRAISYVVVIVHEHHFLLAPLLVLLL